MKSPTTNKLNSAGKTKIVAKKVKALESTTKKSVTDKKYSATITMGSLISTAQGNDESIFSELSLPKVTNKCLLVVENNENHEVFETTFPPFMAKKLFSNSYIQKFQWKRITSKIA